jgi:hypothetical protein
VRRIGLALVIVFVRENVGEEGRREFCVSLVIGPPFPVRTGKRGHYFVGEILAMRGRKNKIKDKMKMKKC